MEIQISPKALKQFGYLTKEFQQKIKTSFQFLKEDGFYTTLDIKKLKGIPNHYRLRVGNYRVKFEYGEPDKLLRYWVGKRSKAY